jgi:hypothetical protein
LRSRAACSAFTRARRGGVIGLSLPRVSRPHHADEAVAPRVKPPARRRRDGWEVASADEPGQLSNRPA